MNSVILAVETSCDETACAIVKNGNEILSNVVSSQISVHKKFGGVVPEVASRLHVENISLVIEEAIKVANISWEHIDAVAVTQGPGLIGSLHVGVQAAKTLAWMHQKPFIPIHHLVGHIYANSFVDELQFPLLALVVSGGHTELVFMKDEWSFEIIGETQDDAIGEAYDKVARVLGLSYPGGPEIDKLSKVGSVTYVLPKPKTEKAMDFSFSGLKSAVLQLIQREEKQGNKIRKADLAATFQETAMDLIIDKTMLAVDTMKPVQLVLAGGVAANSALRQKMIQVMELRKGIHLTIPPLWCCTDNAAMIASAGAKAFEKNKTGDFKCSAMPSMEMM